MTRTPDSDDPLEDLPLDSDSDSDSPSAAPPSARPRLDGRSVLLVFAGGVVGTGIREGFALAFPAASGGFPTTIFVINVLGAFVLGALLEVLARSGPDDGGRRSMRLLLGTGLLGGFTTYSAFAVDTAVLLGDALPVALLYAGATLVVGLVSAFVGIVAAGAAHTRSRERSARP
ncbi:fluoride efflux transporter FluC [Labedella endophytica]|uniref:Fluoride-specific ion channel FluC n=1 Tax=Labedella endophytica TaxID=1523160 RepID=A0A433JX39_9MICO|nr:CrcB family protein [Labedella endophytica]RUR03447.1 CrcB family protein [Labedella endophytica]